MSVITEYRGRPVVHPGSRAAWCAWLEEHHASSGGIWLARWPRSSGRPELTIDEMVEEALCFGWIDGQLNVLPDGRRGHLLTPRRRGSAWAQSNRRRVERLIAEGRMTPAGLVVVEAARADGSWSAYEAADSLVEPGDLSAALDAVPEARGCWDAWPRSLRKGLLWWVLSARRPETRARRVASVVEHAREGRRPSF